MAGVQERRKNADNKHLYSEWAYDTCRAPDDCREGSGGHARSKLVFSRLQIGLLTNMSVSRYSAVVLAQANMPNSESQRAQLQCAMSSSLPFLTP